MRYWLGVCCGLLLCFSVSAAIDTYQFASKAQEEQYRSLTQSLRCPKCQNNSIADSNAMIAADMRQKVYQLTREGQSRQQITDYMVARYGNFVNYQPPITASTLILWLGPLLFVFGGVAFIFWRSNRQTGTRELAVEQQQRLQKLLKDNEKSQ